MTVFNISTLLMVVGALVLITNIVTQVAKNFIKSEQWVRIFVLVFSIVITIITVLGYCQIKSMDIIWYYIIGAIIGGIFVAYGAMYGYDNLKKIILEFFASHNVNIDGK